MEVLDSDLKDRVLAEMGAYDYTRYTAADVKAALEHTTCSLEDFKASLTENDKKYFEEVASLTKTIKFLKDNAGKAE